MADTSLENEIAARVETLGFELVELEQVDTRVRPILRIRIDRPDAVPGRGVTLDDCAHVSRALEEILDHREGLADRYVLEVSSPGVDRPLVRARDFARFAGREVAVIGRTDLAGLGRRLEGELVGLDDADGTERVRLRLESGDMVDIPRADIARVHLIFRWH